MDNLTWFAKLLIWVGFTLLAAIAVMALSPLVTVALTYWEALVLTTIARVLPTLW